ncbi:MAG TPA: Zn-dependent hydrolase [Methylomirabilota bacterium]|jgi:N-carbamoyl-L-amino-acid hydrolase|nr:Zn-dependent hydrolase [Methylomirabilota bacterium]
MPIAISLPRLRSHIETLSRFGRNPGGQGITRSCWSPAHEEARAWLLGKMKAAGLETRVDPAGNTFGRLGGEGPVVMTGSHIDTVPQGGPLDGALGVLAGLECLQAINEAGARPRRPLVVAAWSDEEGRYGSLFGSRAFTGKLDPELIPAMMAADGERLVDAMGRAGFNALDAPKAKCDPQTLSAYVELHIEQGPHLEAARIPIGVVEGIVGIRRYRLTFVGEPDHAGTTPMAWRKDAFLGAAEYALKAREHIVRKGSGRSVTNFGRIELQPGVSNIVPARALLLQEMRELDPKILARLDRQCLQLARAIAKRRRLRVEVAPLSRTEPARCAPRVLAAVERACEQLRLKSKRMPSGAGHDAQNLASITDSGMLFIPSRGGRSHRPDEMSDWKAIERGANVLLHTLRELAG